MVSLNDLIQPINPLIRALLRSPLHPIASRALLVLSWSGRTSGKRYSTRSAISATEMTSSSC